jgi:hypothetical protein
MKNHVIQGMYLEQISIFCCFERGGRTFKHLGAGEHTAIRRRPAASTKRRQFSFADFSRGNLKSILQGLSFLMLSRSI